jgi:pimeloyl-ACP methyl ester carboxylesterase
MTILQISGGELHYTSAGSGPPLCLNHQYSAVSGTSPLAEGFTPHFMCYAINARGIEGSGPVRSPADLTMEALADDLEAARIALGLERWVMAGHSTGGMVALIYALRYPEALLGLILSGSAASHRYVNGSIYDPCHPHAAELHERLQAMLRGDPEGAKRYRELVFTLSVADPTRTPLSQWGTSFGRVSAERLQAFIQHMPGYDLEPDLPRITAPTLVIVGRYDPQCPIENSERIAESIPGARLMVCEHSGHFPFIEEPVVFRETVQHFATELRYPKSNSSEN